MGTFKTPLLRQRRLYLCLLNAILLTMLPGCALVRNLPLQPSQNGIYQSKMELSEDLSVNLVHLPRHMREDQKVLATLLVERTQINDDQATKVYIRKISRGYAAETPLDESREMKTYFSLSHDRDADWFLGLRARWQF